MKTKLTMVLIGLGIILIWVSGFAFGKFIYDFEYGVSGISLTTLVIGIMFIFYWCKELKEEK